MKFCNNLQFSLGATWRDVRIILIKPEERRRRKKYNIIAEGGYEVEEIEKNGFAIKKRNFDILVRADNK